MSEENRNSEEKIPEGMVRKRRKVRRKRRSKESTPEKNADSLFSRAKELLLGMHEKDEHHGPVDVAEQVRRLKKRKDDELPLDDVWGTKKRSGAWLWVLIIGIIAPVVAIVIGITKLSKTDDYQSSLIDEDQLAKVKETEFDTGEGPLGWYNSNSVAVVEAITDIIQLINEAKSPDEIKNLLRDSPDQSTHPIQLENWGSACLTNALSGFQWDPVIVSDPRGGRATGSLIAMGNRENGDPYKAYFVFENNQVLLDWDATIGWSEMSIDEIASSRPRGATFVRCLLEKKDAFDQKFGEIPYSGYVLSDEKSGSYFIAYIPLTSDRNKIMDRGLRRVLNYGSVWEPLLKNKRVTVKVRFGTADGNLEIFEIVDFEYAGWLRP